MSDRIMRLAITVIVGGALGVCAGLVPIASAKALHKVAHRRAHRIAHHDGHSAPFETALNVAIAGTATASTQASGSPASNAIDGDASTQWCSTQWTGNVTVDLGSVRLLNGFGLTLGSGATTALANISAGTDPKRSRRFPTSSSRRRRPTRPSTGRCTARCGRAT